MVSGSTSAPVNNMGRYAHIDALRALAVTLVVVAHYGLGNVVPGGSGVTIFFSISGFVITSVVLGEYRASAGFSPRHFYRRRLLKLGPPLLVVILIPTLIYAIASSVVWAGVASQIFFVYNWYFLEYGQAGVLPGSDVLWSLAIEEQFYIVFAALWFAVYRSRRWAALLGFLSFSVILYSTATRLLIAGQPGSEDRIYYGTDTRVDAIAWGIVAALICYFARYGSCLAGKIMQVFQRDWVLILAGLTYVVSLVYRDEFFRETLRFSMQSIAASSVILYGFSTRGSRLRRFFANTTSLRPIQVVGLASYSIYLIHLPLGDLISPLTNSLPLPARILALTAIGMSAGIACWRWIEQPVAKFANRRAPG